MSQFVLTFTYVSSWLILPPLAFHILLHATVSAMDCSPNVVSKRCFFFIFKHSWAPKRSWKIFHDGPGKSWKSPGFLSSQRVGTLLSQNLGCSPCSRPMMFGSAESEHPRLTNGEIISDVFQPMWSQSTNVTERQTDGQTDRRHVIAIPSFALMCIAR